MNKSFLFVLLLLFFLGSCRGYKMLDGRATPVYLTPDPSVFNDTAFPDQGISYDELHQVRGNTIGVAALERGEVTKVLISEPTFFNARADHFLVYPGEHITIKKGNYNDYTFEIDGNQQRNNELLFFKKFSDVAQFYYVPDLKPASVSAILALDEKVKTDIPVLELSSEHIFDSLSNVYNVSSKFKKIARNYFANSHLSHLFHLYLKYKDTLLAHGLYYEKCNELIAAYNNVTEKEKFRNNTTTTTLSELADEVLPLHIWRIKDQKELLTAFDSVDAHFQGLPKDYLYNHLMYQAFKKRIEIPAAYMEKYDAASYNKDYKKIIGNVISEQERNDEKAGHISSNSLVQVNGKKMKSLEELLDQNRGKYVLLDFWTSWCAPCREEIQPMKRLMQDYSKENITFLTISLDRETQPWKKAVIASNLDIKTNYLMVNPNKSAFVEKYDIHSIPRYILIDKEGNIINLEAPTPSDPKLRQELKELFNK